MIITAGYCIHPQHSLLAQMRTFAEGIISRLARPSYPGNFHTSAPFHVPRLSAIASIMSDQSSAWLTYSSDSTCSASPIASLDVKDAASKRQSWMTSQSLSRRPSIFSRVSGTPTTRISGAPGGHCSRGTLPIVVGLAASGGQLSSTCTPSEPSFPSRADRHKLSISSLVPAFKGRKDQDRHQWHHRDEQPRSASRVFLLPSPTLTYPPPVLHVWPEAVNMDPHHPSQGLNLSDLLAALSSPEDGSRKMAAFKLQSLINDPSFAEHFVIAGGLPKLRALILEASGNTLAYGLASFARLLEVDQGWEAATDQIVEKAREEITGRKSVETNRASGSRTGGLPTIGQYPQRSDGDFGVYCLATVPRRPILSGQARPQCGRISGLEARNCRLPAIFGDAGNETILRRPCFMRECTTTDQFAYAGCYYK